MIGIVVPGHSTEQCYIPFVESASKGEGLSLVDGIKGNFEISLELVCRLTFSLSSFALYIASRCRSLEFNYTANSTPLQCIIVGLVYLVERISTRHQLIQLELAIFIQS